MLISKPIAPLSRLLAIVFFLLAAPLVRANHLVGMDLFYAHVSGNTYTVTLIAYANCGSAGAGTAYADLPFGTPTIHVYNGSSYIGSFNLAVQPPSAGVEITPVCPAYLSLTQCTSLSNPTPGIKKFVYSANYTLPFPFTSSTWRFMFSGRMSSSSTAGRAVSITNISSTPVTSIQLIDTLNNLTAANSSPNLTNIPTPFFCLSTANNYNPGAVDPDADSLRFQLVPGINGTTTGAPGGPVSYVAPYSGTNPLAVTAMTFDETNGQISFTPSALQRSLVVYNVREFRSGVLVGTCQREMTFLVQTCTAPPPDGDLSTPSVGTIVDATHFQICKNSGAFTIHIDPYETITTNNITVTTTGLPAGLTFTTTGNGTPTPHCLISWTSTGVAAGTYTFYVTYTDNNCPLAGTRTKAYTITILPAAVVSYTLLSAATCTNKAAIAIIPSGGGSPWTIKVSSGVAPFDTIQTFTGITTTFTDSLAPGSYTLTVIPSSTSCRSSTSLSVVAPTFTPPTATATNPTYCGASDGTIKLTGLVPGAVDTIRYYKNGILQAPLILTVSADGSVTMSGLIAATYGGITVSHGSYCTSTPVGPFVLVNPPFTMRALTSVNPSYCGFCDGSVTLYGLLPGLTDTITYYKGGVLQPIVVSTIGADSTVTISGMCPGLYYAFTAKTAGVCVSNVLGPVLLSAPPFTASAVTHTDPSHCGFCDGTITIHGLHPGQTDTVAYSRDGVAQTPLSFVIGSDSTATITGLCAGVYSSIVVHTAGTCSTSAMGPVTLTASPLTIRAISYTDPEYCGLCTGTITLYGLYPGQTDTIRYRKDGVWQIPVVHTIGGDSTVVISGLCAGVYDSIVANTAGICISNVQGPVTLTVPPFALRATSHTNPDYCGICNGTITLYGLYPGMTDTVTYTRDGVPEIYSAVVATDSTITITGLCAGTYDSFIAHSGGICASDPLGPEILTVPPFALRATSHTNPDYCGICNGTITLSGLYPGMTDTITYTRDGIAQTHSATVATDSTITITGLCAGIYDNFVAHSGGICLSDTLGPEILTVPPFALRATSHTNPDYCGICNGTITLYGLYPGMTDTITYTRDGIAQTHSAVVATDSTITITGLCAGTYDNFVAHSGGICISDTLGPEILTVPPFALRATSHTNPDYCGICNGTITLYGLYPGMTDTITYTRDGTAQTHSAVVAADSTITITGLCAGTYDNFVAHSGGICISDTLGPEILTVPPFALRATSHTEPDYCGICNGTITLYGLYPGMTDTITYTQDGVPQTHSAVVAADSTITITGLCAGTYDDFVAHSGGICISDTVGPEVLTVPPFALRTSSHINPDYCGICNGSITLYGLYPGMTDTITYTRDGGAATYSAVVASDSTITISGLCAGTYADIVAHSGGVCFSDTVGPEVLTVPPFSMRALSFTNPPYCGICTGTITLYGLYPGQTDTLTYIKDSVVQTPVVHTIGPDSTITLTGLCAGTYYNFVAHTAGICVSNTLGPAVLTVPPFTMDHLTFTNPPYCGICTGTITLHGLYPGQSDTITLSKDGATFPPVVQTVAADSTIVITGLCAGLYDNIVAHTGGVCTSNTLGPANLTVPPFTMRALNFHHATKCGWCDGDIVIRGLHPGQTDTIYYNKNGTPQPPQAFAIGPDSTVTITGLCAGTYSDFVARTGGICVSNTLGPVTLTDPPIVPDFTFHSSSNCKADTVRFTNNSTPPADLTYSWVFGDGDSSFATNPTHIYTTSSDYQVILVISNTKCVDSLSKTVAVNNILKAGFTAVPDSFICSGDSVIFTNTSTGMLLKYLWSYGDGGQDTVVDRAYQYTRAGVFNVVLAVSNGGPCRDTAKATIMVDSIATLRLAVTDSVLCGGHTVTFTGVCTDIGRTSLLWTFNDSITVAGINPIMRAFEASGKVHVRFDGHYRACPDVSAERDIWIFDHPQVYLGSDTTICAGGDPIKLADDHYSGVPGVSWLWSTGEKTQSITIGAPGDYWVKMTVQGCSAIDTIHVAEDCYMNVPNAFTPDGDGINDYFMPRPMAASGLRTFTLNIYNRWGQLIFTTDNTEGRGWDGRFNGTEQPEGVYIYTIDASFIDGQRVKKQGNVTLLR